MRVKAFLLWIAPIFMFLNIAAWADQIILKDGTAYSGKFLRGDATTVEFQVLGKIETFKIANISEIKFKQPELATPAKALTGNPSSAPLQATQASPQPESAAPVMQIAASSPNISASSVTLPAETPITIRTATEIDTDRNRVGDAFDAIVDEAVVYGDRTVVPRGAGVKGRIAYAKESGKLAGQSQLILELTNIVVNGKSYKIRTSDYSEVGSSRGKKTAATVGGMAALGTIIGAIAGGGKGAAVGAASGASVGTGVQVLTKGQVLKVPAETILEFKLNSPLTVDAP